MFIDQNREFVDSREGFSVSEEAAYFATQDREGYNASLIETDLRYLGISDSLDGKGRLYDVDFAGGYKLFAVDTAVIRNQLKVFNLHILKIRPLTDAEIREEVLRDHCRCDC